MSEETVARVSAIVDSLQPLTDATSGEPVRADEWNMLVGSVIDLARIALASEQAAASRLEARFAPSDHQHLGAVGATWLDATAREQLEGFRGRLDVDQRLATTEATIAEVVTRVDRLADDIAGLRRKLLTVEDNDLGRGQRLDRVATAVDALGEQDAALGEVRSTLHGLRTQLGLALSLRRQLSDAEGNPIDLVAIRTAVDSFAADRERLIDAAGDVLDARAVEQRLARLETGAGGGGGVGGPVLEQLREELFAGIDERVASGVDPVTTDVAGLRDELAGVRDAVSGQDAAIDDARTRLSSAEQRLVAVQGATAGIAELATRVGRVESTAAMQGNRLDGFDSLVGRIDALDTVVATFDGVPERLAGVESRMTAVDAAVSRVPAIEAQVAELGAVRARVDVLTGRVDEVTAIAVRADERGRAHDTRFDELDSRVLDDRTRLDTVERNQRNQRAELERIRADVSGVNRPTGPVITPVTPFRPPG